MLAIFFFFFLLSIHIKSRSRIQKKSRKIDANTAKMASNVQSPTSELLNDLHNTYSEKDSYFLTQKKTLKSVLTLVCCCPKSRRYVECSHTRN